MAGTKTGLVVTAHPGDFVWRAGGAIALHARKGYRVKIVCLSFGERGESQFAWKETGATLDKVKAGRRDEAARAAEVLGAEIEFFDAGDYPLRLTEAHFDRMVDIYRELNPSFVLTHALEDPYNFDHPNAAHFAQETRVVAQAMGHKPGAKYTYAAPPVFLFEPHQPEQCNFKPQVILNIDEVWETKRKAFEILAAQKHLWEYYTRVALNRGVQGGRNAGTAMTYGEAYQRLFPSVVGDWMRHLRTLLGDYPHTAALKNSTITSDRVALDFVSYSPTNKGFKPMVREQAFDVSEMAIVTYLIAKSFDKPMVLLPAVMMGRFQHRYALYNPAHGHLSVSDLKGKRVGIRSFTTTTGAWVRGILANDCGVDLDDIHWISFEEPHVAEYVDSTERAPPGRTIIQMLLDGELDAVIGETSDDPRLKPLFGDATTEEKTWFGRHGVVPVNHFVVVSGGLAASDPEAVREVFRMLKQSKQALSPTAPDPIPFGVDGLRKSLDLIVNYAAQQRLIPQAYRVEDLFDDLTRTLR